jgi:1,4-dihydroxy-2-naphthoate octaprenyltransferase
MMSQPKALLGPMRLPFLVLPPACVLLGAGTAIWTQGEINPFHVVLAFIGAVTTHISVNALNEYFDFRSGLDLRTQPTPFSGGSGTLPARPELARSALTTGLVALAITVLIGLYFLAVWGWSILPLGLLGLLITLAYTPWVTHSPFLCLIAPGLGFGLLMVMGTDFVLSGEYTWTAFVASLIPTFLVSNLLLLNQFPDVEADESVGRRHYPIVLGRRKSSIIYGVFLFLAYLAMIVGVLLALLPVASLLGLFTILVAVPTVLGVYRYAENLEKLVPYLGYNVLLTVVTPVLVAVGLLLAA